MGATSEQREQLMKFFDGAAGWTKPAVLQLASEADAILAEARIQFGSMVDELPYLDRPDHSMAGSMFACAGLLAIFKALRERGLDDAHAWGRAIHSLPAPFGEMNAESGDRQRRDAEASQANAAAAEFVFEVVEDEGQANGGMNITSCAICHLYGRHDAMELVPYMCAFDDLMSRAGDQGLRRTGTIALGASQCDFRFESGGEPLALAGQYPDQIRLDEDS